MAKETWEQFQRRVAQRTTEYVQQEYQKWVERNPEEFKKIDTYASNKKGKKDHESNEGRVRPIKG